ncbi:MAG: hypothetical protein ABI895_06865 [Deltaproteobacteria bacterium]
MIEARWLVLLALVACTRTALAPPRVAAATGVGHFQRPPGMPIGTRGQLDEGEAAVPPPEVTQNADLTLPAFEAAPAVPVAASPPCSGCVELNVDVNDINQRDEFVFDAGGVRVTRVVWTILVSFNSDQLAVQPLVDDKRGKYTSLHVNTFPLGKPVEVTQDFKGKAHSIGLIVGSSGAWTGNQTMSVFVDSLRVEGPAGFTKSFDASDEGLAPRTHAHQPRVVAHPELTTAAPPPG